MTDSVSSTTSTTTTTSTSYSQNRNEFDSEALAEEGYQAKLAKADSLETEVSDNETTIAAYQDMQSLLQTMQDTLENLRGDPSSSGQSSDVFLNRTAYLTSSTSTDADSLMAATVEDGTDIGSHDVEITQVAKAERLGGSSQSSKTEDLGLSGDFTLGTTLDGTSSSATITITSDMSLGDIVDTINDESDNTGVSASVIQVSSDEYMLVLTAADTAASIDLEDSSGGVLQSLGVLDSSGDKADVLQEAQTAQLTIDGVAIERSSNTIDDALDGVTLTLYKAEEGNTLTLEVASSLTDIKEQVQALVDTYNSFRDFVITNQSTGDDGSADTEAVLFGDSTLRSVSRAMQTALSTSVDGVSLADAGLSLDSDNKLVLDEDTLDDALLNDFDAIEKLFRYSAETSSGSLSLLSHGDGPSSAEFTMDITVGSDGSLSSVSVDGDSSLFTVSGARIVGAEGSDYEGLTFVYTGTTTQSIDVTLSQGIADQLWQTADDAADDDEGQLASLISSLEDTNSDLEDRISTIQTNAETYREYLLDKYSSIEAKLSEAQSTLDLLEAMTNAESDD